MHKTEFTADEVQEIFELAHDIEELITDQDFSIVFNALLVVLANGGRTISGVARQPVYMHMVENNMMAWWEYLDESDKEDDANNGLNS
jgi:hypothetical protein